MSKIAAVLFALLWAQFAFAGPKTVEELRVQIRGEAGHLVAWGIIPNALAKKDARYVFLAGGNWKFGDEKAISAQVQGLLGGSFGERGLASPIVNVRSWLKFHEGAHEGAVVYFEAFGALGYQDPPKFQLEFNVMHPVPIKSLHWLSLGGVAELILKAPDDALLYGIRGSTSLKKNVLLSAVIGLRESGDKQELLARGIVQFYFRQ
ncbi:MAG: hypothetical protein A3A33_00395 [Candidatus Yanofskybacteria bacterium RIFCSPLOWO2_01_FULL_49_25]|uniref:Uncharacterized protein n=1 Tax=Candidatus Yanofskybacteria bacterium RIFCSPLOWO2_01_FULL_49_25 TaxID=1802701 RepID=A0A1F8GV80_9BACT|nr:MAG: hypothetical protein A3A33_00395 [Candidatus Yanofskybacteria bacterium RIFCSPLOWO2_01_FULL_49_25]